MITPRFLNWYNWFILSNKRFKPLWATFGILLSKEVRNFVSRIMRVWSLFCLIRVLYKSAFSTDSFGKLAFCLSALCQIEFDITFINFKTFASHNHYLYNYQVLCVFVLPYFLKEIRVTNIWVLVLMKENMPLGSFWAFKFEKIRLYKKIWNIHKLSE